MQKAQKSAPSIAVEPVADAADKARLCAELIAELPMWFGRADANARYIDGIAEREAFAAILEGRPRGLIAVEIHFDVTCNVWWLGVSPGVHRRGLGRALIERIAVDAAQRGCRYLAVETMAPAAGSPEYDATRLFYAALGFTPFVAFEPEPGDPMMWMLRPL
jgi:GNAT superfamily N-acetyltransferase